VTWGPDHPSEGKPLSPGPGLAELWPFGPLTEEERREQDERFELVRVSTALGSAWGVWDSAYKRLVWTELGRGRAERAAEGFRVSCALWEERIARGATKEETEELVETLAGRLRQTRHNVRAGWLSILRSDQLDAELHLTVFLADAQRIRRRARAKRLLVLV
jgi:hypothetical protein